MLQLSDVELIIMTLKKLLVMVSLSLESRPIAALMTKINCIKFVSNDQRNPQFKAS